MTNIIPKYKYELHTMASQGKLSANNYYYSIDENTVYKYSTTKGLYRIRGYDNLNVKRDTRTTPLFIRVLVTDELKYEPYRYYAMEYDGSYKVVPPSEFNLITTIIYDPSNTSQIYAVPRDLHNKKISVTLSDGTPVPSYSITNNGIQIGTTYDKGTEIFIRYTELYKLKYYYPESTKPYYTLEHSVSNGHNYVSTDSYNNVWNISDINPSLTTISSYPTYSKFPTTGSSNIVYHDISEGTYYRYVSSSYRPLLLRGSVPHPVTKSEALKYYDLTHPSSTTEEQNEYLSSLPKYTTKSIELESSTHYSSDIEYESSIIENIMLGTRKYTYRGLIITITYQESKTYELPLEFLNKSVLVVLSDGTPIPETDYTRDSTNNTITMTGTYEEGTQILISSEEDLTTHTIRYDALSKTLLPSLSSLEYTNKTIVESYYISTDGSTNLYYMIPSNGTTVYLDYANYLGVLLPSLVTYVKPAVPSGSVVYTLNFTRYYPDSIPYYTTSGLSDVTSDNLEIVETKDVITDPIDGQYYLITSTHDIYKGLSQGRLKLVNRGVTTIDDVSKLGMTTPLLLEEYSLYNLSYCSVPEMLTDLSLQSDKLESNSKLGVEVYYVRSTNSLYRYDKYKGLQYVAGAKISINVPIATPVYHMTNEESELTDIESVPPRTFDQLNKYVTQLGSYLNTYYYELSDISGSISTSLLYDEDNEQVIDQDNENVYTIELESGGDNAVIRSGALCSLTLSVRMNTLPVIPPRGTVQLTTLPSGYRPRRNIGFSAICTNPSDGIPWSVRVMTSGEVFLVSHDDTQSIDWTSYSDGDGLYVNHSYMTANKLPTVYTIVYPMIGI